MAFKTADLCDEHSGEVAVAESIFKDYGGKTSFYGRISTVKVHEDNVLVKEALGEQGDGRVLIVDGGGSMRCALLGDRLAAMAIEKGWNGVVVYGCIRDSAEIKEMALGVKALSTHPMRSIKKGAGDRDVPVKFAGISFVPGHYIYADEDGIIVSAKKLI